MPSIDRRESKNGHVTYRARVRISGTPIQTATFRLKSDAKRWAQQTEAAISEKRFFPTLEARKRALSELIDAYVANVLPRKPASARDQGAQLKWWCSQLGDRALEDLTPGVIGDCRDKLGRASTRQGALRSPATVNRYLAALSHCLTYSVKELRWLRANPMRDVSRLREPRGRVRFLSDDEKRRLLASCQAARDPRLFPLVVLALSTGARRGEILRLCWKDIDTSRSVAIIHHTKNDERRAVPVTGYAMEMLKRMSTVRRIDTDLIFPSRNGKPTFPRKAWEQALSEARLENFRFHDLRHTAASYLAMSGATLAEIAEVLGHKTLAMVKRYSHLTEQHTIKVVARMNERMFGPREIVR